MMTPLIALLALQAPIRSWQDTSIFRPLPLPAPTRERTASGAPGPEYWQQRADYTIRATLDTAAHTIAGAESIRYTNNSPDTLRFVWLQLDQNLFREKSRGSALNPGDTRWAARGFAGGFTVDSVRAVRRTPARQGRPAATRRVPLATFENETTMRVDLDEPLPPRGSVTVELVFSFMVPEHGADRMGREQFPAGWLYEIAQWYPRLAVYDDVRGWNTQPYLGQGEFYLEYGDFDVSFTVPRGFIVAATGTLQNPEEVLTAAQRARLAQALRSDTTVAILAKSEVGQPSTRPAGASPTLTWRFVARNVRDVAWAAAPNFIWDASGWNGILMQSFYPPVADTMWRHSTRMVRHSIQHYSEKWFPYPYPTAINVNGPVGGMEYPMLVFCANRTSFEGLFGVTTHELGHQWYPMVVGQNERLYAWMDEGFDSFINIYSQRAFFPNQPWLRSRGQSAAWAQFARTGMDQPPMLPADRISPQLLGNVAYAKPATGLYLLRHVVLDSTQFDQAFREYTRRWAYRHPEPADFFRTMDDVTGEDLSWFWRGWFYRTDVIDLAVDTVMHRAGRTARYAWVTLTSPGGLPMPVTLRLTYADGKTETVRLPVEIWFYGNRYQYVREIKSDVTRVLVDPDEDLPDVNRANNGWPRG